MKLNERKCGNCQKWVDGNHESCPDCNTIFYEDRKKDFASHKEEAMKPQKVPLIPIYETDSKIIVFFKHIIRVHQMVFFAVVSFIAYMVAATAG